MTVVTEDSDIFTSCPGKTDVRGKGSQFEAAFNFIRHVALQDEDDDNVHILCIDSDLKGEKGQQTSSYTHVEKYFCEMKLVAQRSCLGSTSEKILLWNQPAGKRPGPSCSKSG